MDHLPPCAVLRQPLTVIVRIKMEVTTCCSGLDACPVDRCPEIVHRPSGCELCSRTRLVSQYSDCDSGKVGKCRPYKSSSARSNKTRTTNTKRTMFKTRFTRTRATDHNHKTSPSTTIFPGKITGKIVGYVNVCAAVCLLLLVGGLSPSSSAAPHSRTMDRQKRDTETENYLWSNPCSYNAPDSKPYTPKDATHVAQQAKDVYEQAASYKDQFTKLHSFDTFENLLTQWNDDWLRKFSWFREEVLPQKKVLFQRVPDEDVVALMTNIDAVLPSMYKALKMIMASLNRLSESLRNDGISSDQELSGNVLATMNKVGGVLCYFYDLMKARNLEILPVYDSEIPDINTSNKLELGLYIYRDTLNYLEYISQVFHTMSETDLPANA